MSEMVFTIEDVLCVLDEIEPGEHRRAYKVFVATLRQGPLDELYRQIEQMAEDAGTDRQLVGWEREAVLHHRTVDRLLASEGRAQIVEMIDEDALEVDFQALLNICDARRRRGEGDAVRLEGVERTLRLILAAQRQSADAGTAEADDGRCGEPSGRPSATAA